VPVYLIGLPYSQLSQPFACATLYVPQTGGAFVRAETHCSNYRQRCGCADRWKRALRLDSDPESETAAFVPLSVRIDGHMGEPALQLLGWSFGVCVWHGRQGFIGSALREAQREETCREQRNMYPAEAMC
jgi:hypothetical protein